MNTPKNRAELIALIQDLRAKYTQSDEVLAELEALGLAIVPTVMTAPMEDAADACANRGMTLAVAWNAAVSKSPYRRLLTAEEALNAGMKTSTVSAATILAILDNAGFKVERKE